VAPIQPPRGGQHKKCIQIGVVLATSSSTQDDVHAGLRANDLAELSDTQTKAAATTQSRPQTRSFAGKPAATAEEKQQQQQQQEEEEKEEEEEEEAPGGHLRSVLERLLHLAAAKETKIAAFSRAGAVALAACELGEVCTVSDLLTNGCSSSGEGQRRQRVRGRGRGGEVRDSCQLLRQPHAAGRSIHRPRNRVVASSCVIVITSCEMQACACVCVRAGGRGRGDHQGHCVSIQAATPTAVTSEDAPSSTTTAVWSPCALPRCATRAPAPPL
jgi:hypothetical protein